MAHKTGRIFLNVWDCPSCPGLKQIPGYIKSCPDCGSPQPRDVKFKVLDMAEITDPALLELAKLGPDVICPFCTTPNRDGTKTCVQCGGDLDDGEVRKTGDDMHTDADEGVASAPYAKGFKEEDLMKDSHDQGAAPYFVYTTEPPPPSPRSRRRKQTEHTEEPTNSFNQQTVWLSLGAIVVIGLLIFASWWAYQTWWNVTPELVTVNRFFWTTTQQLEVYDWVEKSSSSSPPANARNVDSSTTTTYPQIDSCTEETKDVQVDTEEYNCRPKDLGNGFSEEVCDERPVYEKQTVKTCVKVDDKDNPIHTTTYTYEIQDWEYDSSLDVNNSGTDQNPIWLMPNTMTTNQRLGNQTQSYTVFYIDSQSVEHSETKTFSWDLSWFQSFYLNQQCVAKRNGRGTLNAGLDCSAEAIATAQGE